MAEDDTNKRIETITDKIQKNKAQLKKKLFKEFLEEEWVHPCLLD